MGSVSIGQGGVATIVFDDGVTFNLPTSLPANAASSSKWHIYDTKAVRIPNSVALSFPGSSYYTPPPTIVKLMFEVQDVWMGLRDYPALEFSDAEFGPEAEFGNPVSTGDITKVDIFGPVSHVVDNERRVLVNQTTVSHTLHEGYVVRHVWGRGRVVFIQTIGFGTGDYGWINSAPSSFVWGNPVSLRAVRAMATQYYQQRTGRDSEIFPHEAGYDQVPLVAQ